jgi:transcriptional regulator with XRE-family HTH domain
VIKIARSEPMTVIDQWTGRHANALRAAMRMTNEAFAERLGVASRTIAKWRERQEMVPSPQLQEALDTMLHQANDETRARFAANLGVEDRPVLDAVLLSQLNTAVGDLSRVLARMTAEPAVPHPPPLDEIAG